MAAGGSYTHRDLAKAVGVTVTTIKSYRRKFPAFLPVESRGKPLRLAGEALAVCKRIRHHFHQGLSVADTAARLAGEFPALAEAASPLDTRSRPQGGTGQGPEPGQESGPDRGDAPRQAEPLARIEALMGDLFSLQNRTHSLMAELVSKLDTLTEQLAATLPEAARARTTPPARTGSAARPAAVPEGAGAAKPGPDLLALPVVVHSGKGEFLGVTGKSGRPFALGQFEDYLLRRAEGMGSFTASWRREGQEWVLSLVGQGQVHAHHFRRATTPKGNTVALFASLTVGGKTVSEAFLQTFLRQVKESLDD